MMYQARAHVQALHATGMRMVNDIIERHRACVLALQRGPDADGQIWVDATTSLDEYIAATRVTTAADSHFYGVPRFDLLDELADGLRERPQLMNLARTEGEHLSHAFKQYCWDGDPQYGEYIGIARRMRRAIDLATWKWGTKTRSTGIGDELEDLVGDDGSPASQELLRVAGDITRIDARSLHLPEPPGVMRWVLHPLTSLDLLDARNRENTHNITSLQRVLAEEGLPALFAYGQARRIRR